MKKVLPLLIFQSFVLFTNGQDIHFTQFTQSPLFLNPATSGNFDGDIRVSANYKNQWFAIPVPYNSGTFGVDFNFLNDMFIHGNCGIGVLAYMDEAGDSRFRTMGTSISFSFNKFVGKKYRSVLSFGLNAGFVNKGLNTEKLRWDEQFNGDFYDPKIIATDPNFLARQSLNNFDLGAGINYITPISKSGYFNIGFSLQHINAAYQSFYANAYDAILQKKPVVYTNMQFPLTKKLFIKPEFFYQWQDDKHEFVGNLMFKYVLKEKTNDKLAVSGGVYLRAGDAFAPTFRLDINAWTLGLSYDINSSALRTVSSYQGGIELSLIYIQKYRKKKYPYNFCPFLWM